MPRTTDPNFACRLGFRIRSARIGARLSQTTLGEQLGISFQQIQKYENGTDRVSVKALVGIAKALGRPAAEFFDEADIAAAETASATVVSIPDMRRHARVSVAIDALPERLQRRVIALIDELAATGEAPAAEAA